MIVEYEGKRLRPHELAQILEHPRPTCRACGGEMSRGRDLCPMCEPGYELAITDVVEWLRREDCGELASKIESGKEEIKL
jgi:tRNA(Ile2) C34 agmatinyltransferase TiaS